MASSKKDFKNISFKVTEREFSPEVLEKIKTFFNAQKSKQETIGLMTQFFIDNVGYMDLSSYEGVKLLTQSQLAPMRAPGTVVPEPMASADSAASDPEDKELSEPITEPIKETLNVQPSTAPKSLTKNDAIPTDESPGRDDF